MEVTTDIVCWMPFSRIFEVQHDLDLEVDPLLNLEVEFLTEVVGQVAGQVVRC